MKKATAILLAVVMVLSLGSISALAADSAVLPEPVDGVITLTEDVALTAAAVFSEGDRVTLDLNGHTVSRPTGGVVVALEESANLTVKDSSEAQSGAIMASGEGSTAVYLNGSGNTLRLQSGAIRAEGKESVALYVKGDAKPENYASNAVQLRGGAVSASGENAQAILAFGSANFITVNGCAVSAEGDYVYGVALNTISAEDEGGSQFTLTKGSVSVNGSRANAIYSEGPASGKANAITIMEISTTTVSAVGNRANAIVLQNYNEADISGGTISAANNALTTNQKDKVVVSGGTLSGAVGSNVACGSGGSVQFQESWDGSAPTVQGSTAAVKAQYTWRGRTDDTAMIQITAGRFDGAITSDATKTGDDQDPYTYYDILGGSFSDVIEDSAYYNFAAAKGLTAGEYDASKETNVLHQGEDGRYYIVEKPVVQDNPFTDVSEESKFYDAILWAYYHEPQITTGTTPTTFSPSQGCTRGQVVTFLWRAAGCPEPQTTVNPFSDVSASSPFYQAILWAAEQGITTGVTPTTFCPGQVCTRGQVVTFLWRYAKEPAPAGMVNPFSDVSATSPFYQAILWAAEQGITTGVTPTTFCPGNTCTRGQVVAFLYRALAE